jgi:solute carrier family 25 aspartate/glutamate transporter 12/13
VSQLSTITGREIGIKIHTEKNTLHLSQLRSCVRLMPSSHNNYHFYKNLSYSSRDKIAKLNKGAAMGLGVAASLYVLKDVWQQQQQQQPSNVFYAEETQQQPIASTTKQQKRRVMDKKQQKRLKNIFKRYATQQDNISGDSLMTPDDFIRSILERNLYNLGDDSKPPQQRADSETLRLLFQMADTKESGKINFSEYVLLFKLLTTPETEFEMAFRMFDVNNDGTISKDEFKQAMKNNKYVGHDFDFDCELMSRFFGRDGHSTLSYHQFSQFMRLLTEEIRRQEFQRMDNDSDGFISAEQFGKLLTSYISETNMPQRINENIRKLSQTSDKISYAEFDAFNRIMHNMDAIASSIRNAASQSEGQITKADFSRAAKRVTGIVLSPMEVSIIFKMFSSNNEDVLSREDYEEFINILQTDNTRRQYVLDAWSRDQISAKDGVSEMTFRERFMNAAIKVATKTLYGGIAGAIGATAVYPIDMVKTRMQNQRSGGPQLYKNSLDCFKTIYKFEGFRGMYRGLIPQLIGVAPEKAIKLVTNDYLRDLFGNPESENEIYLPLEILAGMGAGASQVVFTNPIEIVKIRLQVQGEIARQEGIQPKSAMQICKELGFAGLYRGATACFARDIPFSGIYFPTYAAFKEAFRKEGEKETTGWGLLLAGSIAGALSASSTTPFDVVKTRLQVEARKGQQTYTGIFDCFKKVYKAEGILAFYKGIVPRTLRSSPQFGVTLLAYEFLQRYITSSGEASVAKKDQTGRLAAGVPLDDEDIETIRHLASIKAQNFKGLISGRNI